MGEVGGGSSFLQSQTWAKFGAKLHWAKWAAKWAAKAAEAAAKWAAKWADEFGDPAAAAETCPARSSRTQWQQQAFLLSEVAGGRGLAGEVEGPDGGGDPRWRAQRTGRSGRSGSGHTRRSRRRSERPHFCDFDFCVLLLLS